MCSTPEFVLNLVGGQWQDHLTLTSTDRDVSEDNRVKIASYIVLPRPVARTHQSGNSNRKMSLYILSL